MSRDADQAATPKARPKRKRSYARTVGGTETAGTIGRIEHRQGIKHQGWRYCDRCGAPKQRCRCA